jgi:hypothetical protein
LPINRRKRRQQRGLLKAKIESSFSSLPSVKILLARPICAPADSNLNRRKRALRNPKQQFNRRKQRKRKGLKAFRTKCFGSAMPSPHRFQAHHHFPKRREDARSASLRAGFVRTPKVRRRTDSSCGELSPNPESFRGQLS